MEGIKFDFGKSRWDIFPWEEAEEIVKVLEFGARKYEVDNWKRVPGSKWRYLGAAFRHLIARACGEYIDKESGMPHLAHAGCCLLFLAWHDKHSKINDKKAYISGPITGKENYNTEAFNNAQAILEKEGYSVVNPLKLSLISPCKKWNDYMRDDIKALMDCDIVFALDDWEGSKGANIEIETAISLEIPVYSFRTREIID